MNKVSIVILLVLVMIILAILIICLRKEKFDNPKWVCVSGYFDPFHVGHLEYLEKAKKIGDKLVVIVNSDHQAKLKKGKSFMPAAERCKIISALRCVDHVVESIDKDRTVRETLRTMQPKPDYFCNGGDQDNSTIPEVEVCRERGIELRDGFGDKIQSSSWLLGSANKK
jgi:D-beta-D-heptose 7-phosphate kinase/D-beta-D-heptose 1-phosphate adenosyltransferase